MQQKSFFKPSRKEHGGILALGKRRSRRPLTTQNPLHLTLRSDFAYGPRSLLKHRGMINAVLAKASKRFGVRIYRKAICGNHLHLLIKGDRREDIQNFFRVVAGHVAQEIVKRFPISSHERKSRGGAPQGTDRARGCAKNQRKFWKLLLYSRVITWGREFQTVARYILRNTLEALNIIAYQPRTSKRSLAYENSC